MPPPPQSRPPAPLPLGVVILAAGLSRRAAPQNKLLLPGRDGTPVIRGVARAFCQAGVGEPIVVTGHQREAIEAALAGLPLRTVYAADFAAGLGRSLAAGIRAVPHSCRGFLVCPGDLPGMSVDLIRTVAGAFAAHRGEKNIIPVCQGVRGHPVALVAGLRAGLETLVGDQGARGILAGDNERARTLLWPVASAAIHRDNDQGKGG